MSTQKRGTGAAAIVGFTKPFRLVVRDQGDAWSVSLEEVNAREYDYVKLNRLSTSFDIGLAPPLCLHIGYDGSVVVPAIPSYFPLERAVSTINQLLGECLLVGQRHFRVFLCCK